jgi:hypothetical protein
VVAQAVTEFKKGTGISVKWLKEVEKRCRHRGVVQATALLPSVRKSRMFYVNVVISVEESREGAGRRSESII